MTREERKAERRAQQATIAAWAWAHYAAKNTIKAQIRAEGLRLSDFTAREVTIRAEAWLEVHPELIAEARARAAVEFAP